MHFCFSFKKAGSTHWPAIFSLFLFALTIRTHRNRALDWRENKFEILQSLESRLSAGKFPAVTVGQVTDH